MGFYCSIRKNAFADNMLTNCDRAGAGGARRQHPISLREVPGGGMTVRHVKAIGSSSARRPVNLAGNLRIGWNAGGGRSGGLGSVDWRSVYLSAELFGQYAADIACFECFELRAGGGA